MTKAKLTTPNGTEVQIEGTPEEVSQLLALYSSGAPSPKKVKKVRHTNNSGGSVKKKLVRNGPADLIRELITEEYFKGQKRSLADIQKKLEEGGHIYAQTSLSTPVLRLVKSKELRRLKEAKGWMYVV